MNPLWPRRRARLSRPLGELIERLEESGRLRAVHTPAGFEGAAGTARPAASNATTGDPAQAADAHVEFHTVMVGLTGSRRLAETERALMRDLQLVIASIDKSSDDLPQEIRKHALLCELFCQRQVQPAIASLEEDLRHAKAFVIRHARS